MTKTDHVGNESAHPDHSGQPDQPDVHWFVRRCAYLIPVCVFPSALWRLSEVFVSRNDACFVHDWELVYLPMLSLVSMGASLMSIGFVRRWGDVAPSWIPVLGGRLVSVRVATGAALLGILLLTVVVVFAVLPFVFGYDGQPVREVPGCPPPEERADFVLIAAAYAPLALWLPLLVVVTVAYYRRRTRRPAGR